MNLSRVAVSSPGSEADLGLQQVKVEKFRCLDAVEFSPDPHSNLFVGINGAGKTSVLEAIFFLSRGRSFRAGQITALVQAGAEQFTVFAEIDDGGHTHKLGISGRRGNVDVHIDGVQGQGIGDLAALLPVQVIDPEVHQLIQGGPQARRRFMDWGVFHVKHDFLDSWRRYRRALQQRNAALRRGSDRPTVQAWDAELIEAGSRVDSSRREYLGHFETALSALAAELLGMSVGCRYQPGWLNTDDLENALVDSWERDRAQGSTQVGPHRAELVLMVENRQARYRLSRGQQKLLGAAMTLAQSDLVASAGNKRVVLLVDEPAAELDEDHLKNLINALVKPNRQLFFTALEIGALPLPGTTRTFHVERGSLATLV